MSANDELQRRIADHFATEAPPRAPDWVLGAALETIDGTSQRRALSRLPWRVQTMNSSAKAAVAAVAVVAVAVAALAVSRPGPAPDVGATPSPAVTSSPDAPGSSSPAASGQALTETFTSAVHGISMAYPTGWFVTASSRPWIGGAPPECGGNECGDHIYESETDSAFLNLASQPLGGRTGEAWAADVLADPALFESSCPAETEPITIDGAPGMIATLCPHGILTALAWVENRGYLIILFRIDDVDWFKEVLATVDLRPEDAVDAAPSSAP